MAEEYGQLNEDLLGMSEAEAAQYAQDAGWTSYLMLKQAQEELRRNAEMFDLRQRERELSLKQEQEEFDARRRQVEELVDARMQDRQIQRLLAFAGTGGRMQDLNEPMLDALRDMVYGKSAEAYPTARTESVNTIFDNTMDDLIEQVSARIQETYSETFTETVASTIMSSIETKLAEIKSRLEGLEAQIG